MTEGRKAATAQRRNPPPGETGTGWARVLKLALISRFLDDTEELDRFESHIAHPPVSVGFGQFHTPPGRVHSQQVPHSAATSARR